MTTQDVLFVNRIEVAPDRQEDLTAVVVEALEQLVSRQPGYRSGRILASLDGRQVVVETAWDSVADIEATGQATGAFQAQIAALGTPSPSVLRVVAAVG